jgi:hypothetical protein
MLHIVPVVPRRLGLAGLMPQFVFMLAVWSGPGEWHWTALAAGWAYAALIFSFLGGMWWGIAALRLADGAAVPGWLWLAAVLPSLLALVSFMPWVFGREWPGPSLAWLGLGLLVSPLVDRQIARLVAPWWLRLRLMLSVGLAIPTLLLAWAA